MKSLFIRLMLLFVALTVATDASATTALLSSTRSDITLRVSQYNVKKKDMLKKAINEALQTVLFRGVEGTSFNRALCGTDEETAMKKHKAYFNKLLNERAESFVTNATPVSVGVKDATGKKAYVSEVTINMTALRKDLENQKIIRKFGLQ